MNMITALNMTSGILTIVNACGLIYIARMSIRTSRMQIETAAILRQTREQLDRRLNER